jgi:hypothetical protein
VINVDFSIVTAFRVALTKIPTVPELLSAVNLTMLPVEPFSEPSELEVITHAYVMPELGQAEVHDGVAVNASELPGETDGEVGLMATDMRVLATPVMSITVDASTVCDPSVALTKMPTDPDRTSATKFTEEELPLRDPNVSLESFQT